MIEFLTFFMEILRFLEPKINYRLPKKYKINLVCTKFRTIFDKTERIPEISPVPPLPNMYSKTLIDLIFILNL